MVESNLTMRKRHWIEQRRSCLHGSFTWNQMTSDALFGICEKNKMNLVEHPPCLGVPQITYYTFRSVKRVNLSASLERKSDERVCELERVERKREKLRKEEEKWTVGCNHNTDCRRRWVGVEGRERRVQGMRWSRAWRGHVEEDRNSYLWGTTAASQMWEPWNSGLFKNVSWIHQPKFRNAVGHQIGKY